jgi:hypothetical protein
MPIHEQRFYTYYESNNNGLLEIRYKTNVILCYVINTMGK